MGGVRDKSWIVDKNFKCEKYQKKYSFNGDLKGEGKAEPLPPGASEVAFRQRLSTSKERIVSWWGKGYAGGKKPEQIITNRSTLLFRLSPKDGIFAKRPNVCPPSERQQAGGGGGGGVGPIPNCLGYKRSELSHPGLKGHDADSLVREKPIVVPKIKKKVFNIGRGEGFSLK